ncbi:MAG: recombination mediator RecR [Christensenellales bacterium]
MSNYIEPIGKLINNFSKLPGVGNKTAARYAYYVINSSKEDALEFAESIKEVKEKVKFCSICGNYTEEDPCLNCTNNKSEIIVVVAEPKDVAIIEKVKNFSVSYHCLHGTISPLNGKGPDDIRIAELLKRVNQGNVKEVIMATNTDVEGEATAMYIARLLKPLGIKVTRLAQGVSMGADIEFADEVTLTRALDDRKEL